jgi:hypothetical protein
MEYSRGAVPEASIVIVPLLASQTLSLVFEAVTIIGKEYTVILYDEGVPAQPFTQGVTIIVAEPEPAAVKLGTLPMPFAAKPIAILEFVHVNVVPVGVPAKFVAETVAPEHTAKFAGKATTAVGLTVIV